MKRIRSLFVQIEDDTQPPLKKQKVNEKTMKEVRNALINDGVQSQVQVNQRALIDKMLAKYAGDYSTFRELIQNADDAESTKVNINFTTNKFKNGILSNINEIQLSNNGRKFTENDWNRVSKIAEGNPDEQTVGMFGVGFYSIFSYTEEPMIYSNNTWLSFFWEGDQLCTRKLSKKSSELGDNTCFFFSIRDDSLSFSLEELCEFFKKTMFFSKSLQSIELSVNEQSIGKISKNILSSTRNIHLSEQFQNITLPINIIQELMPSLSDERANSFSTNLSMNVTDLSLIPISIESIMNNNDKKETSKNMYLITRAKCIPNAKEDFQKQCYRVLKKNIPKETFCSILLEPFSSIFEGKLFVGISTHQKTGCSAHMAGHFYPTIERENIDFKDSYLGHWNSLLLYVCGLCNRYLYDYLISNNTNSTKNILKSFSGNINMIPRILASIYSFHKTPPQEIISEILASGFFDSQNPPLIKMGDNLVKCTDAFECDVKMKKLFSKLELSVPSLDYDINDNPKYFFNHLKQRNLLGNLSLEKLHESLENSILSISEVILLLKWICNQIDDGISTKSQYTKVLKSITYHENTLCKEKSFSKISYFASDQLYNVPVPLNVLPYEICSEFSNTVLSKQFSLKKYTITDWLKEFLKSNRKSNNILDEYIINERYSMKILKFLSSNLMYIHKLSGKGSKKIFDKISELPCIPSTSNSCNGISLKKPSECAIDADWSRILNFNIISMDVSDKNEIEIDLDSESEEENISNETLSKEFLKEIGVNVSPPASFLVKTLSVNSSKNHIDNIEELFQQRNDISDEDWTHIRGVEFIKCKIPSSNQIRVCSPYDCYLSLTDAKISSLSENAIGLWNNMMKDSPIVQWDNSPSYEMIQFLSKKLHIHPFPSLDKLFEVVYKNPNNDSRYKKCIEFYFCFFTNHYKEQMEIDDAKWRVSGFLGNDNKYYCARDIFSKPNPFFSCIHKDILDLSQKYSVQLKSTGIRSNPKIPDILEPLKSNVKQFIRKDNIVEVLEYLHGLNISSSDMKKLKVIPFIPSEFGYLLPTEIFVKQSMKMDDECKKDTFPEIFSYQDYSDKANEFLISCGAKSEPSLKDFAHAMTSTDAPKVYFESESFKPSRYIEILTELGKNINSLSKSIITKLQKAPILLAIDGEDNTRVLTIAKECFLIDNTSWKDIVKPIYLPINDTIIENLYSTLGSKWLTSSVTETASAQGRKQITEDCKMLQQLIHRRCPLFLHHKNASSLDFIKSNAESLIFKLSIKTAEKISRVLVFQNHSFPIENAEELSMCTISGSILYLHESSSINYFDIGHAISSLITSNQSLVEERGTMIAQLLQTPLKSLSKRGWPVDRFLKIEQDNEMNISNTTKSKVTESISSTSKNIPPQSIPDFHENQQYMDKVLKGIVRESCRSGPKVLQSEKRKEYHSKAPDESCQMDHNYSIDTEISKQAKLPFYKSLDSTQQITQDWISAYKKFSELLTKIVSCVPELSLKSCNIFVDDDSDTIAFNFNRTLYFNLRYYYQCHYNGKASYSSIIFHWFITLCHELAHNEESAHNVHHERCMESLICSYIHNVTKLLQNKPEEPITISLI